MINAEELKTGDQYLGFVRACLQATVQTCWKRYSFIRKLRPIPPPHSVRHAVLNAYPVISEVLKSQTFARNVQIIITIGYGGGKSFSPAEADAPTTEVDDFVQS